MYFDYVTSHPMWVRGLKPRCYNSKIRMTLSHPMWVRGLKPSRSHRQVEEFSSHPMWVRGLKLDALNAICSEDAVAPHVGAWIETSSYARKYALNGRRTPCGCVD